MELTLDQALQKGIEAHKAGKAKEADQYYTAILKANPKHPDANHNMGVLAVGVGKVEAALPFFKTAVEANPSIAQYWLSYIDALIKLDRTTDAKAVFNQAKNNGAKGAGFDQLERQINARSKTSDIFDPSPGQIQTLINLYNRGQLKRALIETEKPLLDFPNSVTLYNILGAVNHGLGKPDKAIEAYNKAISIKPDYAEAYNNLGITLHDQGKLDKAIDAYNKAISIKPDYAEAYYNLGITLNGIIFNKPNRDLQKTIVSLLDQERYTRPKDIAKAAISLVKLEPNLQKYLKLVDADVIESPQDVISDLSAFPLLQKLMSVCPLPDLELEGLLTNLRRTIMLNISSLKEASPELIGFQSALALQCFTNEYIYNNTDVEKKALRALEKTIKSAFKNYKQPSPQALLAIASYKALNQYDWCNLLIPTDSIQEVFTRQVEEPNEEKKLRQDLPILKEISDNISSEVREQYEESPYPRWINVRSNLRPMSISQVADESELKLHDHKIIEIQDPKILIAGCGTGQHSIGTATRFKSSKVLAIDLSLSSLAYAKRKTDELGIENIKYMQADILDLNKLYKQFDIIESGGVLHHMDNPLAGWRVLTDCLKPGGLMKLGLYSELARSNIVKIKQEIKQQNIESKKADMKSLRNMIVKSKKEHHKLITASPDFYSLSAMKDLLFHVKEHRFTIPKIEDHISKLGLKFCGFESKEIVSYFKQTNIDKEDPYDLDKWQAFEHANPKVFIGMYQFWCQKTD